MHRPQLLYNCHYKTDWMVTEKDELKYSYMTILIIMTILTIIIITCVLHNWLPFIKLYCIILSLHILHYAFFSLTFQVQHSVAWSAVVSISNSSWAYWIILRFLYSFWKDYHIGTLCYNWPMSAHASQAFSTSTVPIWKTYLHFRLNNFSDILSCMSVCHSAMSNRPILLDDNVGTPTGWHVSACRLLHHTAWHYQPTISADILAKLTDSVEPFGTGADKRPICQPIMWNDNVGPCALNVISHLPKSNECSVSRISEHFTDKQWEFI